MTRRAAVALLLALLLPLAARAQPGSSGDGTSPIDEPCADSTGQNMTVTVAGLRAGDVLRVYTEDGRCVGERLAPAATPDSSAGGVAVVVWGWDPVAAEARADSSGAHPHDRLSLALRSGALDLDERDGSLEVLWTSEPRYFTNAVGEAVLLVERALPAPTSATSLPGLPRAGAVTLRWDQVEGADAYDVQLAADTTFQPLYRMRYGVRQAAAALSIGASGRYYWRVRARRGEELGPWTEPAAVEVGTAAAGGAP